MDNENAFIFIDLQREFLSPLGLFKENHIPPYPLLENVKRLVSAQRSKTTAPLVIWVRSEYDHKAPRSIRPLEIPKEKLESKSPPNNDFLSSSHFGKRPCCPKNNPRSEFHDDVRGLISLENVIITKRWYSSFTETNLLTVLHENKVRNLWIGGVVSNVCVMATICDAYFLGFQVFAIEDCMAASSKERHTQALDQIEKFYGERRRSEDAL